jgi:sulfite reductase (NADPH) flavoprotein alpha-component
MTLHAIELIPATAPFSADERALLNAFFARAFALDAPIDGAAASVKSPVSAPSEDAAAPWHDPSLALEERMKLAAGRPLPRRMMAAMGQQDCGQCGYNCEDYANSIFLQAEPRLNLCVPGGKATARMLKVLVEEMGGGVIDPDVVAAKTSKPAAAPDARPGRCRDRPVPAILRSRAKLSGAVSRKAIYHVELDIAQSGLDYQPGDSLGVFPANDQALVDAIVAQIAAPPDFPIAGRPLRQVLVEEMSLAPAPDSLFQFISYLTGGERRKKAQALSRGEDPDGDAAALDVLAALQKFQQLRPDPEAFVESLEPLQPRLYSISSSPRATPGRVSLTIDTVRYELAGRVRCGVASTFLCERAGLGRTLMVYVQKAHAFGLPRDPSTPIIMVGPGTGIAPFRAFLQERAATGVSGAAWLFFGHQHAASDFLYRDELEQFRRTGTLSRLSTAWSRDGANKVYVQDRMRQSADELWSWLEQGAHFYVCGDALRMARDVEAALLGIAAGSGGMSEDRARAFIAELKATGRYQADVY